MTDREVLVEVQKLLREALPQFNWGASCLDAHAISLLNRVPQLVDQQLKEPP